jgi:hypothetical protein
VSFEDCVEQLDQGLQIDYNGASGPVELSSTTGDVTRANFEVFRFEADGADIVGEPFLIP